MTDKNDNESASLLSAFDAWRKRWAFKTNMGLSEEERAVYEKNLAKKEEAAQCFKCEEYKHWMLNYSKKCVLRVS